MFKTVSEPHIGDINYVRVLSGVLKAGDVMMNSRTERDEKANQIYLVKGKERTEISRLVAGQIGGLVKLKTTKTSDTLSDYKQPLHPAADCLPGAGRFRWRLCPSPKAMRRKSRTGLSRLHEEDPTFKYHV